MSLNKNMRVLIVDDYTTMLRILRNLLRQLDINNVEEATDGDTRLSHAAAKRRRTWSFPTGTWCR